MDKTAYKQLVRKRVLASIKQEYQTTVAILCDQYTSITEADNLPRWTFLSSILERAYEARTGHPPIPEMTGNELNETSLSDYRAAYRALETALQRIFHSPKPNGV